MCKLSVTPSAAMITLSVAQGKRAKRKPEYVPTSLSSDRQQATARSAVSRRADASSSLSSCLSLLEKMLVTARRKPKSADACLRRVAAAGGLSTVAVSESSSALSGDGDGACFGPDFGVPGEGAGGADSLIERA